MEFWVNGKPETLLLPSVVSLGIWKQVGLPATDTGEIDHENVRVFDQRVVGLMERLRTEETDGDELRAKKQEVLSVLRAVRGAAYDADVTNSSLKWRL